jgi:F0F1-type ATP synthase assembly protein I
MELFKNFGIYWREAPTWSWVIPLGVIIVIWIFIHVAKKTIKNKHLKTIFIVNQALIISSLFVAGIIIGVICYWWTQNIFAIYPLQLPFLLSLTVAMLIPIFSLINLRKYCNLESIKEITEQPKTIHQLENTIPMIKKSFSKSKIGYLIPLIGFLFLLFYLNKGTNLISIVFDNSISMNNRNAIDALSETFIGLEENNEIVLTTLDGVALGEYKNNIAELMAVNQSSKLKAGKVVFYNNPKDAMNNTQSQLSIESPNSPISESIWKMWLLINENKANQSYKNKLLIVITDGDDPLCSTLQSGGFFFDNNKFAEYFSPDNVFIIDYSGGNKLQFCNINYFIQRFEANGCNIYPAENSKDSYLDALNEALQSFKNNWHLIYWTILIFFIFTIIGLLIPPKKII